MKIRIQKSGLFIWWIVSIVLLNANMATAAMAQEDEAKKSAAKSEAVIEEVTVTAQRRTENIQKVPISITAFDGTELANRGITSLEGIAARTPSFVYNGADAAEPYYFIRGVGTESAQDAASETSVAIYVDDVYIGRGGGANFDLFDLERVEVLRGPQGTLFGRNASAGVIHLISQKPQDTYSARVEATAGNYNRMDFRGMVTGPLSDGLAYKFAASSTNRDGYVFNEQSGNDLGDQQAISMRGSLLWQPSEDLDFLLSVDKTRESGLGTSRDTINLPGADTRFNLSNLAPRVVNALNDGNRERDIFGIQLRIDYSMDWATLTSITAQRQADFTTIWSFSGQPVLNDFTIESYNTNIEDSDQFTQELRLTGSSEKFDWVGGLYYFDMDTNRIESFNQHFNGLFQALLGIPLTIGNGLAHFNQDASTESWAVFAQGSYHFTEKWSATAGLRYTDEKKSLFNIATATPTGGGSPIGLTGSYTVDVSDSWDAWTPHFSVDFQLSDDALLYGSITQGFKSGAFSGTAQNATEAKVPLEPESVWNYEIGAKTQWLNNRLQVNAAAFYMDFEDLQIGSLIPGQAIVRFNSSAEIKGFELETLLVATEDLRLGFNYSHLDNTFTEGPNNGKVLPRSPDHKTNLSATYDFDLGDSIIVTLMADWAWQSKIYHEPDNRPSEVQESYSWFDAGIQFANRADTMRLYFWTKNLTDELVAMHQVAVPAVGQSYVHFSEPRTYGVTASFNF
jgi:iron complex outermembrane receptor protein